MDLYAYLQIGEYEKMLAENGIEIPRLRGIRYMAEEETETEEDILSAIKDQTSWMYQTAVQACPRFHLNSCTFEYSKATRRLEKKYLVRSKEGKVVGFRWDKLHGKNKKRLRLAIRQKERKIRNVMAVFNKYVGRPDVLCIHARIGGRNWIAYDAHLTVEKQPWFLEKVDDYFDSTYCDIYVKIKTPEKES